MSFANRNVRTGFTAMCLSTISFHGMANNGWTWRSVLPDDHLATESPQDLHKRYYGGYFNPLPSNKSPQYILSGDSYGAHYAFGLNRLQEKGAVRNWIKNAGYSCFHLPNLTRVERGTVYDCAKRLEETLNFSQTYKSAIIIMSYSWVTQLQSASTVSNPNERGISRDVLFKSLSTLFQNIDNEVIVIGMLPTTGRGELWSYLTSTRFVAAVFGVDDWRFSLANQEYINFNKQLESLVLKHGQKFVDPFNYLCDDTVCTNVTPSGKLIYSDDGHLSIFGSEYLINRMHEDGTLTKLPD